MNSRKRFNHLAATLLLSVASLTLPLLPVQASAADLVVSQGSEPISFDPTQFATGNHVFLHHLYDALVVLGPNGEPLPALAESWERSDDGLRVTFHLRDDATFHSGRKITADDVVFTIERYLAEEVGANLRERMESFEKATAIDDRTFEIALDGEGHIVSRYLPARVEGGVVP